ncbi:MAG: F0F1 ATP synthase subunit B [Oscillospiraceae bacterium]|nr:F0F1 ATP synthase subunit B [Clostridia bacterium]MBQ7054714.1 F0F1 ATP synthase subunit B [Oscillospiraceae bacterium]
MQTLDVISVNLWQMAVSLLNLILLFLIIKYFLYNPVKKMLANRQNSIESDYTAAREAKEQAESDKKAYEEKLSAAKAEAEGMIKAAAGTATAREKEIIAEAKEKADGIIRQAETEAELERRKAEDSIKKEIASVSSAIASKMLEREISADDHKKLIDSFLEGIGDEDDAN